MMHGLRKSFEIFNAAGASQLESLHSRRLLRCHVPDNEDTLAPARKECLQTFLDSVQQAGTSANTLGLFSAHQMGSCRMGSSSKSSVVDCDGETWECDELYVMDASVFPTASGANPMFTTLAIAQLLSARLVNRLQTEDKVLEQLSSCRYTATARVTRRQKEQYQDNAWLYWLGMAVTTGLMALLMSGYNIRGQT